MRLCKALKTELYVALVHFPVLDKNKKLVVSSVTNLDLHDISRASKTFGVKKFYVLTPLVEQQEFVEKIKFHWTCGYGKNYNPKRKAALDLIEVVASLDDIKKKLKDFAIVSTSAKKNKKQITFANLKKIINENKKKYLICFGTAWGLDKSIINQADHQLEPIYGEKRYNHLSVRSAVSIVLDRLTYEF